MAVPASPAAGWTKTSSKAVRSRTRPLATALRPTPPAMQTAVQRVWRWIGVQQVQVRLLQARLQRGRDVLVARLDRLALLARRSERLAQPLGVERPQRRRSAVPGHVHALAVVEEVLEAEPEEVAVEADDVAHHVEVARLAVGGEAHDLALVAPRAEAQVLRDRRVGHAQRVRVEHAREDLHVGPAAVGEHRAGEVPEAVDREDRRLLEGRDEERAGEMGAVVLDVVELRAQLGRRDAERLAQRGAGVGELGDVAKARDDEVEVAHRQRAAQLGREVGARVARDRDVVELVRRDARVGEAPRGRERREARGVLDAAQALLLHARDQLAVDDEHCGGVPVIRVETQDLGHAPTLAPPA